jgi:hypothetical protein
MRGRPVGWYLCDECFETSETDGVWCPKCRAETTLWECETWMLDLSDEELLDLTEKGEV